MSKIGWRVALVLYDGAWASTVNATPDLLQSINLRRMTQTFSWDNVTPAPDPIVAFSGYVIAGDTHMGAGDQYDLIILAHFWGDFDRVTRQYPQIAPWLREQYAKGAVIAGVNSGVFWAAEAGLLDTCRATTYWRHIDAFRKRYPAVDWQDNQSLVEDRGIYSSNGQNAANDLTMHLIEKFCGAELATDLARDITFDSRRNYDLTLLNIAGLRHHRDNGIHKAQDWLDNHYHQNVRFGEIADKVGMSKSTFIRRFHKATGKKPGQYLQRLRVEAAKHQLINSDDRIKTISLNVGYRDFGYFSAVFKLVAGIGPRQFRTRFRPRKG